MKIKIYFNKDYLYGPILVLSPVIMIGGFFFVVVFVFVFSLYGRGKGEHIHKERCNVLVFGRQGKGKELFLCLLLLTCFQLKIIFLSKWHIFWLYILIPFSI